MNSNLPEETPFSRSQQRDILARTFLELEPPSSQLVLDCVQSMIKKAFLAKKSQTK